MTTLYNFNICTVPTMVQIHTYVKVEEKCLKAKCSEQKCCCDLICHHFAIIEVLEKDHQQLPEYRGRMVVKHITRVKTSNRY